MDSILELYKKIRAISQTGLSYSKNEYDLERYELIKDISYQLISLYANAPNRKIENIFLEDSNYQTPKVDIRSVVFKDNKLLLVQEKMDHCWSIPGGYADIGFSPSDVAVKEVKEEAGIDVKPIRVLAVFDKRCHNHPPDVMSIYKIFILCEMIEGTMKPGMETEDVNFFSRKEIPVNLSTPRVTLSQIYQMFNFLEDPNAPVLFD
ncbi:MAG: NUDIX hydrolase [Cyclobacteriaceae bacterium]